MLTARDARCEQPSSRRIKDYPLLHVPACAILLTGSQIDRDRVHTSFGRRQPQMLMLAFSWVEIGLATLIAYALLSVIVIKK